MMDKTKKASRGKKVSRATFFEVEIKDGLSKDQLCFMDKVEPTVTVAELKAMFQKSYPGMYPSRQCFKVDPKGKAVRDEDVLKSLPVGTTATFYFYDLGPQVNWTTVFFIKYLSILGVYFLFYIRTPFLYPSESDFTLSAHRVVHLAFVCHTFHYVKCLLEAIFVHQIASRGTMPLRNMIKNYSYYMLFTLWMAFYINHPLYTPPSNKQMGVGLMCFIVCEIGNYFIHVTLRDQQSSVYRLRQYPMPTMNPFTWPFVFISCPNYTYEIGAWFGFSIMTQTVAGETSLSRACVRTPNYRGTHFAIIFLFKQKKGGAALVYFCAQRNSRMRS
ncbi:very-long-chain enoyl-CoA reductase-like isoform X1 [Petromyzon marinus]|uniref:very-long-chain enoyl-CoA reductase-like isoform X1 n=1 Tax=Petromyzon marinus TaxID=7757 RepID=UPI003F6F9B4C